MFVGLWDLKVIYFLFYGVGEFNVFVVFVVDGFEDVEIFVFYCELSGDFFNVFDYVFNFENMVVFDVIIVCGKEIGVELILVIDFDCDWMGVVVFLMLVG